MKWKLLLVTIVFAIGAMIAFADPNGPTKFNIGDSQRGDIENQGATTVQAVAGNITELTMNATSITKNWQGYFGNISGKITLDNANNQTLYNWAVVSPQGYVYASRVNSITWANIGCMRYTVDGSSVPNLTTEEETYMGASATDEDGLDETFAVSAHPGLTIGSVSITANTCNSTTPNVNGTAQTTDFTEVLLTDNSSVNAVVYTSILEQNVDGFNSNSMDFEMLVAENGHGNTVSTPYYFWVELA